MYHVYYEIRRISDLKLCGCGSFRYVKQIQTSEDYQDLIDDLHSTTDDNIDLTGMDIEIVSLSKL